MSAFPKATPGHGNAVRRTTVAKERNRDSHRVRLGTAPRADSSKTSSDAPDRFKGERSSDASGCVVPAFVVGDTAGGLDEDLEYGRGVVTSPHHLQFQGRQVVDDGDGRGSDRDLADDAGHDEGEAAPVAQVEVPESVNRALPVFKALPGPLQGGRHEVEAPRGEAAGRVAEPLSGEVPQCGPAPLDQWVVFADDRDEALVPQRLALVVMSVPQFFG